MLLGYVRVSTQEQNLDRRLDTLQSAGVEKLFTEKITGTKKDRPKLMKIVFFFCCFGG